MCFWDMLMFAHVMWAEINLNTGNIHISPWMSSIDIPVAKSHASFPLESQFTLAFFYYSDVKNIEYIAFKWWFLKLISA